MRVLSANIPLPQNRYLRDLNEALSRHCDVTLSHQAFWDKAGEFDVVHLHFPEYMTYEHQAAYQTALSEDLIDATIDRLKFWRSKAAIVVTRHNAEPHDAKGDKNWGELYKQIFAYSDGVVHFAQRSIEEFVQRYAGLTLPLEEPKHVVIPHQNYASLPNDVSRQEARNRLRIHPNRRVVLVFGAIRSELEKQTILESFRLLTDRAKTLLVSTWPKDINGRSRGPIRRLTQCVERISRRISGKYRFNYDYVEESLVQHYMNAADVLLIPRSDALNSGNLALGMTFGKIVVGPETGNIGEILASTHNPTFRNLTPGDVAAAITEGLRLAENETNGGRNRQIALEHWSADSCACKYIQFFEDRVIPRMACR